MQDTKTEPYLQKNLSNGTYLDNLASTSFDVGKYFQKKKFKNYDIIAVMTR